MKDKNIPTIEVVILTYNRAVLFEQAMRSVCNQTYNDFTVKVLNNGSTDNTDEVFNKVKAEYPYRKIEYLKLSENHLDDYYIEQRNKFITADYVIVFHDDDLMHPRYIEYLMRIIPNHPECVLLGSKKKIFKDSELLGWDKPKGKFFIRDVQGMTKMYLKHDTFTYPSLCYKAEILKTTPYRSDLYGNAGDFALEMDIAEQGKVCELQDRFVHYRFHEGQDRKPRSIQQRINMIQKYADCLLSGDDECKEVFENFIFSICIRIDNDINYNTACQYNWVTPAIEERLRKYYNLNKWQRKVLFYRTMFYFAKIMRFLPGKKYVRKYRKSKKQLNRTRAYYKILHKSY